MKYHKLMHVNELPEFAQNSIYNYIFKVARLSHMYAPFYADHALEVRLVDLEGVINPRVIDRIVGYLNREGF